MTIINQDKIMVSFKDVHKYFKDLHVINGVNLDIKQGEVVVVCGPSGSGKSTLIRTVNQLETIASGEIWVDGVNVTDPNTALNQIRRNGRRSAKSDERFGAIGYDYDVCYP